MNEFGDDQLSAPPPPPMDPGVGGSESGNPWEQRDRLGFGGALLEAIKMFALRPGEAYDRTRRSGDFLSPLLFAVIVGWFGALLGQVWQFMFQGTMMSFMPPEIRDQVAFYSTGGPAMLAVNLVLAPFFLAVVLFIGSGIHHFCLMLVGALSQSESGFEGTFRVNSYAMVTQLAQIVPILGGLVGFVWFVVLQVIGATRLHRTTSGRALFAALIPWILCCACFGIFFAMVGAAAMSSFD